MSSVKREARRDAEELVRATMFTGDGAGNRRKLISNAVAYKTQHKPGYHKAFVEAYNQQDVIEHQRQARKEERRRDISRAASRNTRAVLTGNTNNAQTSVIAAITVYTILRSTGHDKVVVEKTKELGRKVKIEVQVLKNRIKNRNNEATVHNITTKD